MQLVRRPLAPGELDYELIWLLVSLCSLLLGGIWLTLNLPWPICFFHALAGHPCPSCGATRSLLALSRGQFLASWKWNPLAFIACIALAIFNLYALAVLLNRGRRLRLVRLTRAEKLCARMFPLVLLGVNWVYLLLVNR